MPPLDYETQENKVRRPSSRTSWLLFALTYPLGLLVLSGVDDAVSMGIRGKHSDGSIVCLGFFAAPLFAIAAGIAKSIWPSLDRPLLAVAFALLGPSLVVLILMLVLRLLL